MKPLYRYIAFPLIVIFLLIAPAHSATVWLEGDTVNFHYDDSALNATVSGDTLLIDISLSTYALNTGGSALENQSFDIHVSAKEGLSLSNASLRESGEYIVYSPSSGALEPFVNATGALTARDTNNPMAEVRDPISAALDAFDPTGPSSKAWAASASLDLSQLGTSDAIVNIANILLAGAFNIGDIAFIGKESLQLEVTAVPIPAAIWLFGSALLGLVATGHRRITT